MTSAIQDLRDSFDLVIIDCGALLAVADVASMAMRADGLLLVVSRGTPIALLERIRQRLDLVTAPLVGYVFTWADRKDSEPYLELPTVPPHLAGRIWSRSHPASGLNEPRSRTPRPGGSGHRRTVLDQRFEPGHTARKRCEEAVAPREEARSARTNVHAVKRCRRPGQWRDRVRRDRRRPATSWCRWSRRRTLIASRYGTFTILIAVLVLHGRPPRRLGRRHANRAGSHRARHPGSTGRVPGDLHLRRRRRSRSSACGRSGSSTSRVRCCSRC